MILHTLSSLKTTLLALAVLGVGIAIILGDIASSTTALAPALSLLFINLLVAIFVSEKIKRDFWLLVFHLSLLILIILVSASRLIYMKGWVELTEGQYFDGVSGILHQGPLYKDQTDQFRFQQLDFYTTFQTEVLDKTYSRVRVSQEERSEDVIIRDQLPLVLNGYRFSISSHLGFAPTFSWQTDSEINLGEVYLPSYLYNSTGQALEWNLPGTNLSIWTMLDFDENVVSEFFKKPDSFTVIVRVEDQRYEMKIGDTIKLSEGRLTLTKLKHWIGYEVFYEPLMAWILAVCITAIVSLSIFLWNKWGRQSWLKPGDEPTAPLSTSSAQAASSTRTLVKKETF